MWIFALLACQEPFDADRHDLVGFRVAAFTADRDGDTVVPRVAVIEEGRPFGDGQLELAWFWIDRVGQSAELEDRAPDASGPAPVLVAATERLALVARRGDDVRRAELAVGDAVPIGLSVAHTDRELLDLTDDDLPLDVRAAWSTEPSRAVDPGGLARFTVSGPPGTDTIARFMGTAGTWLELDATTADWTPGELVVDDGEIESRQVGEPGVQTVIALALDGPNGGFAAVDVVVGEESPGTWVNGRFLPGAVAVGRSWVTLRVDDDAPSGLRAEDAEPAGPEATWDPSGAGCVGVSGDFDPTWLLEARCARAPLDGERVLVGGAP